MVYLKCPRHIPYGPETFGVEDRFEEKRWYFSEHEINWVESGTGDHNILCVSSGSVDYRQIFVRSCWQRHWVKVLEGFDQDKFHILAMDPAGNGKSRHPNREYYMEEPRVRELGYYAADAELSDEVMKKQIYIREKKDLSPYSIIAKDDGIVTGFHICHQQQDVGGIRKMVLWGTNPYVTEFELEHAHEIQVPTMILREKMYDRRNIHREGQAEFLAATIPNAVLIDLPTRRLPKIDEDLLSYDELWEPKPEEKYEEDKIREEEEEVEFQFLKQHVVPFLLAD